ncbi:hypothetical protein ACLQ3K_06615 [Tsukamurella sp. DT100]|uniref:hypothetical protein n=1 Tax=Tsukamurella sp. DT100 TaxID=3393415 RepID=UPI003CEA35FA
MGELLLVAGLSELTLAKESDRLALGGGVVVVVAVAGDGDVEVPAVDPHGSLVLFVAELEPPPGTSLAALCSTSQYLPSRQTRSPTRTVDAILRYDTPATVLEDPLHPPG